MTCPSQKLIDKLRGNPTQEDILAAEIFARTGCPKVNECVTALNTYLIMQDRIRRDRDDPTVCEEDRKAHW